MSRAIVNLKPDPNPPDPRTLAELPYPPMGTIVKAYGGKHIFLGVTGGIILSLSPTGHLGYDPVSCKEEYVVTSRTATITIQED